MSEVKNQVEAALAVVASIKADDGDTFEALPDEVIIRCEVTAGELRQSRAALALLRDEVDGWQDISTAPKDGTQIIGFRWPCEDNRKAWPHMCSIAHWDGYHWRWMQGHYLPPTHWQPLPTQKGSEG